MRLQEPARSGARQRPLYFVIVTDPNRTAASSTPSTRSLRLELRSYDQLVDAVQDASLNASILRRDERPWRLEHHLTGSALFQSGVDGAPNVSEILVAPDRTGVLLVGPDAPPKFVDGREIGAGSLCLLRPGSLVDVSTAGRHHLALRHRPSRGGRPGSRAPRRIPDRLRPGPDRLFRVVPAGRGGTPGVSHRADRGARLGSRTAFTPKRPRTSNGTSSASSPDSPWTPRPGETDGVLSASTDPRPFARSSSSCGLSRPSPSTSRTSAARRASPSARFASSSSSSSARAPSGSSGRAASASFSTRSARPASG